MKKGYLPIRLIFFAGGVFRVLGRDSNNCNFVGGGSTVAGARAEVIRLRRTS